MLNLTAHFYIDLFLVKSSLWIDISSLDHVWQSALGVSWSTERKLSVGGKMMEGDEP